MGDFVLDILEEKEEKDKSSRKFWTFL